MAVVAERAVTSRSTLQTVEAGATRVSMGINASVLKALGLLNGLGQLADIGNDRVDQALASTDLPSTSTSSVCCDGHVWVRCAARITEWNNGGEICWN